MDAHAAEIVPENHTDLVERVSFHLLRADRVFQSFRVDKVAKLEFGRVVVSFLLVQLGHQEPELVIFTDDRDRLQFGNVAHLGYAGL